MNTPQHRSVFFYALWILILAAGAPVVNAIKPPPLEAYGALPSVAEMAISPSGSQLATVATVKDKRLLLVGKLGGTPDHKFNLGDIKLVDLYWAGEDFVIIVTASTQNIGFMYGGLRELHNIGVLSLAKGNIDWPLADNRHHYGAAFGIYQPLLAEGRWHQCFGTLPIVKSIHSRKASFEGLEIQLTCLDLAKDNLRVLAKGRKNGRGWLPGPGLKVIAHEVYDDANQKWWLKVGKSSKSLLELRDKYGYNRLLGRGRTADTVLFLVSDRRGNQRLLEQSLSSGKAVELFKNEGIKQFIFDDTTGLFVGYRTSEDVERLVMLDPAKQARVKGTRKAFPDSQVIIESWNHTFDKLIVRTEGSNDSGTWWLVNIAEGSADEIGYQYHRVKPSHVAPFKSWSYPATDGLEIPAVLTLPRGRAHLSLPLIVLPHGGPESRDYPGFDWMAQAFASRGYAVLQPNFRGSSGYTTAFRNAGYGQWGRKMQTDLSDGVAALSKAGIVDSKRVCIVGASYGGYAALAGVTLQSGIYRCAVAIAGVADPKGMISGTISDKQREVTRYWQKFMGVDGTRDDSLDEISPLANAKDADAPVLLVHGKHDTVVKYSQSARMAKALKRHKKPVKLITLKGEDHNLARERTRIKALQAAVSFVAKHNPP